MVIVQWSQSLDGLLTCNNVLTGVMGLNMTKLLVCLKALNKVPQILTDPNNGLFKDFQNCILHDKNLYGKFIDANIPKIYHICAVICHAQAFGKTYLTELDTHTHTIYMAKYEFCHGLLPKQLNVYDIEPQSIILFSTNIRTFLGWTL